MSLNSRPSAANSSLPSVGTSTEKSPRPSVRAASSRRLIWDCSERAAVSAKASAQIRKASRMSTTRSVFSEAASLVSSSVARSRTVSGVASKPGVRKPLHDVVLAVEVDVAVERQVADAGRLHGAGEEVVALAQEHLRGPCRRRRSGRTRRPSWSTAPSGPGGCAGRRPRACARAPRPRRRRPRASAGPGRRAGSGPPPCGRPAPAAGARPTPRSPLRSAAARPRSSWIVIARRLGLRPRLAVDRLRALHRLLEPRVRAPVLRVAHDQDRHGRHGEHGQDHQEDEEQGQAIAEAHVHPRGSLFACPSGRARLHSVGRRGHDLSCIGTTYAGL